MKIQELLREESPATPSVVDAVLKAIEVSMDSSSTIRNLDVAEDGLDFVISYDFPEGRTGKAKEVRAALKGIATVNAQNGGSKYDAGTDYQVIFKTDLSDLEVAKLEAANKTKFKKDMDL